MKVLITGSAGRVGRAIYIKLMKSHQVLGLDTTPCSTVDIVADIRDKAQVTKALVDVDVIVHVAALHAPHVGLVSEQTFFDINLHATEYLMEQGAKAGIKHFVFTSTTALYGYASQAQSEASWLDETVTPRPKTIYHRTKLAAENRLQELSESLNIPVTVLRMSRCFPEPVNLMAVYRLTRGVDARDVASAHACAIDKRLAGFRRFIISGATPFSTQDTKLLFDDAAQGIKTYAPELYKVCEAKGWPLPSSLDRIYDSGLAKEELGWIPVHGFDSVISLYESEMAEVLPAVKC